MDIIEFLLRAAETLDRKEEWGRKLRVIVDQANPQPAKFAGASSCQRSGVCCWRRPCEIGKGEPERIAAHLGITPQQLFREHLIVDAMRGELQLRPRRGQQAGGTFLTPEQTYDIDTPCTFLDPSAQNACRIHDAKPAAGASWHCGMSDAEAAALPRPAPWDPADLAELGWDGKGAFGEDW